jgi:hypothetical protein
MKLAETYSLGTGAKLDKPTIYTAPFSLPCEKYVCLNNSSGNPCKNYGYWQEVIDFLWPYFQEQGISVVQLGNAEDPPIEQAIRWHGKTNIHQSAFILKNSLCLLSNDSMLTHIAGALGIDVVALFGPTSVANHGPYWKTDNSILLESHRNGKLPSFSFNESPRTIDMIKVEEVVEAVLKVLKIKLNRSIDSLYFGSKYGQRAVEVVLDNVVGPQFSPEIPLNLRYDYFEHPQNLVNQLSIRKCLVITDKVIDINIIKALKQNILGVAYEINEAHNPEFANNVRSLGVPISLFTKWDDEKLNKVKLSYFDIGLIIPEKVYKKEDVEKFSEVTNSTYFKTRKLLLSKEKGYLSKTHWLLDSPVNSLHECEGRVIDTPKFFQELEYFYLYNQKEIA